MEHINISLATVLTCGIFILCSLISEASILREVDVDSTNGRIFGGDEAGESDHPWLVWLASNGRFLCGGSLIARRWVLTAGHCLTPPAPTHVVIGDHDRLVNTGNEQWINISRIIIHPNYNTFRWDIGLIKLASPVKSSKKKRVKEMPRLATASIEAKIRKKNIRCHVTGWGWANLPGLDVRYFPTRPKTLDFTLVKDNRCRLLGEDIRERSETYLCFKSTRKNSSTCNGDSGSPVMCYVNRKWTQLALVSFKKLNNGCFGRVNLNTKISKFLPWIHSHIPQLEN